MKPLTASEVIRFRIRGLTPSPDREYSSEALKAAVMRFNNGIQLTISSDNEMMKLAKEEGWEHGWTGESEEPDD